MLLIAARLMLLWIFSMVVLSAVALAEPAVSVELAFLSYIFDPKTGTIAVLLLVIYGLWRALQRSEQLRIEANQKLIEIQQQTSITVQEQRDFYNAIRESQLEAQVQSQDLLTRATVIIERSERQT